MEINNNIELLNEIQKSLINLCTQIDSINNISIFNKYI